MWPQEERGLRRSVPRPTPTPKPTPKQECSHLSLLLAEPRPTPEPTPKPTPKPAPKPTPKQECFHICPEGDVPDHCQLLYLSQPTMLENTRKRFKVERATPA